MRSPTQLRVGGRWADEIAPWGDLTWSTVWPGGCDEASWGMYLPQTERHPALVPGATVELMCGSTRIWYGNLSQPNWRDGTFTADGAYTRASGYQAFDSSGNSTTIPDVAIDTAITAGIGWTRATTLLGQTSISSIPLTTTFNGLNSLQTVLDAASDRAGQRWGVFGDGAVVMRGDPTKPTLEIAPGMVDFGVDDTEYASQVVARYIGSGGVYKTVYSPATPDPTITPPVQYPVDLTGYGQLSPGQAQAFADGIYAKGKPKMGWTNEITVSSEQLTRGGLPCDLTTVTAGLDMFRTFDVADPRGRTSYTDLVIGKTTYVADAETITIAPVDAQPQNFTEVIESVVKRLGRKTLVG